MKRGEIKYFIYGLRKKLEITQKELGELVNSPRRMIGQYEDATRYPGKEKLLKFLDIVKKKNLIIFELINYGKEYFYEVKKREHSKELKLKYSDRLAELIGVLLGDGCIQKRCIIISFNKISDRDHIDRRVKKILKSLLKCNIFTSFKSYENTGEIRVYSRDFIKFLENKCDWKPGNKIKNQTTIPKWCFKNKKYLIHVIRGYFDTDGYLAIQKNSPIVRIRFSNKCEMLIKDMSKALDILNIQHSKQIDKIGVELRIFSKRRVLKFFKIIGSSNIRNIKNFLNWRKIEIKYVHIPFIWNKNNTKFKKEIKEDQKFLELTKIRELYQWDIIARELLTKNKQKHIAKALKMQDRGIRKWREGIRRPSIKKIPSILRITKKYNINLQKCQLK